MITKEQLSKFVGPALADKYYPSIVDQCTKGNIIGKDRVCAFLAQILHESGNLVFTKENLNYSADGLMKTWEAKFPTKERALDYAHQPERIADFVYGYIGNHLGNDHMGDGWKYIGRGLIGVTGKANYSALSKDTGIDFVSHPELLEQPGYALMSAVNFWTKYKLNDLADKGDFRAITQRINGGQLGANNREMLHQKLLAIYQ